VFALRLSPHDQSPLLVITSRQIEHEAYTPTGLPFNLYAPPLSSSLSTITSISFSFFTFSFQNYPTKNHTKKPSHKAYCDCNTNVQTLGSLDDVFS